MKSIIKTYKDGFVLYNTDERKYIKFTQDDNEIIKHGIIETINDLNNSKKITIERFHGKSNNIKDNEYLFIELKTPLKAFWDITEECNANCIHCFTNSGVKADDELATKQVLEVIDQLVSVGIMSIAFSGGEPFIRNDMIDIIQYAAIKGISVSLTTNGTLFNQEKIANLINLNIKSITFSLDGLSQNVFGMIRKGIEVTTLLQNIKFAVQYAHNKDTEVDVRTTLNSLNVSEIFDILKFCNDSGVTCFKVNNTNLWGRAKKNPYLKLDEQQFANILFALQKKSKEYACKVELPIEKYLLDDKAKERLGGCTSTIDTINIFANGDVGACGFCERQLIFGNVIKDGFHNILQKSLPFDFRNEICEQCGINKFKGVKKVTSAAPLIK